MNMDYEKKDSENTAVKTIMRMIADGEISQEVAEKYFPELKESEDERIVNYLEGIIINDIDTSDAPFTKKAILSRLEKMKSNPYTGVGFKYNGQTWGMCARDEGVDILVDSKLISHIDIRQGEQKPVDWDESVIDETISLINKLASGYGEKVDEPITFNGVKMINNIKERLRAIKPQPKQEWSKEDKDMMRNIIDDIHCGSDFNPEVMHAANERVKWFKSICMRCQSKWKPSEEQIKALEKVTYYSAFPDAKYCVDLKILLEQLKAL